MRRYKKYCFGVNIYYLDDKKAVLMLVLALLPLPIIGHLLVPVAINYSKSLRIHHIHVIRLPYVHYTRQAPSVVMVGFISSVLSKLEELQEDFL
jgi:hypothetical protein